jgi:hypothetical protein
MVVSESMRRGRGGRRRLLSTLLVALAGLIVLPVGASGRPEVPGDPTPPVVTLLLYGTVGANGWYVSNVTVNWTVQDPESIILETQGCDARTLIADTVGTPVSCYARSDGGATTVNRTIYLDKSAPAVTAIPARAPGPNDWYSQPLTVAFWGSDAVSGIDVCSQATYAGPDNPNASVTGSCRDRAGNVTPASFAFKYDATPPALGAFSVRAAKRRAHLRWKAPEDASSVLLVRAPGLKGAAESVVFRGTALAQGYVDRGLHPGRNYVYRLTAADLAGNQASKTLEFLARGALLHPAPGERVSRPPLLIWAKVRGASYYNVVLVRGRRVLSAWPVRARLQLRRAWTYRGRRYKLRPGTYSWYVWPGRGPLSAGQYGKLLGGSTFTFGGSG